MGNVTILPLWPTLPSVSIDTTHIQALFSPIKYISVLHGYNPSCQARLWALWWTFKWSFKWNCQLLWLQRDTHQLVNLILSIFFIATQQAAANLRFYLAPQVEQPLYVIRNNLPGSLATKSLCTKAHVITLQVENNLY